MEDYYEYLDSNGVTTLYKLIKDDTVALIDSYSVTINGITTNLDNHVNNSDIHTPIATIEGMIDTKISGLVNSAPETLDTLKELSDALGNDPNFATTVANQIGNKASKDDVYTKEETDTLLDGKANSVHSHVVSDISDFPTIPTKLSQLENDMGFGSGSGGAITSISWTNITDKPNFATVATSGSYTDLSNTPTIPTKVSQLENDTGFINALTDVVDTKSNQTIGGTKKFTYDIVRKYTAVDITTTPTSDMYAHINFTDKNDKSVAYIQYAQKSNGVDYIGLRVRDKNSTTWGVQLNTNKEFVPLGNNSYSLGSSSYKWADVYSTNAYINNTYTNRVTTYSITHPSGDNNSYFFMSGGSDYDKGATLYLGGVSATNFTPGRFALAARKTDGSSVELAGSPNGTLTWGGKSLALDENLVHKTGREVISGDKIFQKCIYRQADITTSTVGEVYRFTDTNATPCGAIYNRMHWYNNNVYNRHQAYNATSDKDMYFEVLSHNDGSGVVNTGGSVTNNKNLTTVTNATGNTYVATMGWVNNPATSTNVVHRSGNETISGTKYFNNDLYTYGNMFIKNNAIDLTVTPSTTNFNQYLFRDKNNVTTAYLQFAQQSDGNVLGSYVKDKSGNLYGVRVTTLKQFLPFGDNTYSLGSSSMRWGNVYATTLNGKLKGNADTATSATKASYLDNYSLPSVNKIYLDWDHQKKGYVGLKVDNTVMGGLITTNNIGSQAANSATYSPTPATSDNSTRIATTAWVRTYVNSVVGSGSIGASISAYYSDATTKTAEGKASTNNGYIGNNLVYPSDYSDYINIAPTVGTIYTGSQLFSSFTPTASGTIDKASTGPSTTIYYTSAKATANFSGAFSPSAKYLCTTANAVKFRAYVSQGTNSTMGTPSVVDNSSAKSIFIRVQ